MKANDGSREVAVANEQAALARIVNDLAPDDFKLPFGDQPLAPHPLSEASSDHVELPLGSSVPTLHRHAGEPKLELSARPRSAPSRRATSA